jgi:hypothetical protein
MYDYREWKKRRSLACESMGNCALSGSAGAARIPYCGSRAARCRPLLLHLWMDAPEEVGTCSRVSGAQSVSRRRLGKSVLVGARIIQHGCSPLVLLEVGGLGSVPWVGGAGWCRFWTAQQTAQPSTASSRLWGVRATSRSPDQPYQPERTADWLGIENCGPFGSRWIRLTPHCRVTSTSEAFPPKSTVHKPRFTLHRASFKL